MLSKPDGELECDFHFPTGFNFCFYQSSFDVLCEIRNVFVILTIIVCFQTFGENLFLKMTLCTI